MIHGKLRIRPKLLLGFGLVSIITLLAGIFGLWGVKQLCLSNGYICTLNKIETSRKDKKFTIEQTIAAMVLSNSNKRAQKKLVEQKIFES